MTDVEKELEEHVHRILELMGEDADREGLHKTPHRVARAMQTLTRGYSENPIAILNSAKFSEDYRQMVIVRDINFYSLCEHHMLPFYGKVHVAYIPNGQVTGLSKIARIADMVGKRLQLQEKIGTDIAEIMEKATESPDVAVIISGKHSCMTARGIKNTPAVTLTTTFRGAFADNKDLQDRVLRLIDLRVSRDDI